MITLSDIEARMTAKQGRLRYRCDQLQSNQVQRDKAVFAGSMRPEGYFDAQMMREAEISLPWQRYWGCQKTPDRVNTYY
jgi:hypothetical protein